MIILHLWPEMILIFLHCLSFRILYANQLTIAVIFESRFGFIGRNYATYPNQGMVSIGGNQGRRQSFIQIISRYRGIEGSMHDDMEAGSIFSAFLTSS